MELVWTNRSPEDVPTFKGYCARKTAHTKFNDLMSPEEATCSLLVSRKQPQSAKVSYIPLLQSTARDSQEDIWSTYKSISRAGVKIGLCRKIPGKSLLSVEL